MPKLDEILGAAYAQIPEDLKKKYKDIDLVDSSNYVEKTELKTAEDIIEQYKKDIKKRDKDLIDLQGKVKDNEELNSEIEKLKIDNEKATKDYEDKLYQINFDNKFDKAVSDYKAKNPKALKALLDMEKVKLIDDAFIGLDEQIKVLRESDSYLFEEENLGGTRTLGGGSSSLIDENKNNKSIGEMLAESKKANQNSEAQNKFFE